jgi:sulfite reductase alpha subunit-like flavoprotein
MQNAAERIAKGSAKRGFNPQVGSMDSYNIQDLPDEELVVFVAATTGDGDAPDSMTVSIFRKQNHEQNAFGNPKWKILFMYRGSGNFCCGSHYRTMCLRTLTLLYLVSAIQGKKRPVKI